MTLAVKTLNFTLTKLVKQERYPENVESDMFLWVTHRIEN
jgi:hypothetical protein